jgi:hypothetical protein
MAIVVRDEAFGGMCVDLKLLFEHLQYWAAAPFVLKVSVDRIKTE